MGSPLKLIVLSCTLALQAASAGAEAPQAAKQDGRWARPKVLRVVGPLGTRVHVLKTQTSPGLVKVSVEVKPEEAPARGVMIASIEAQTGGFRQTGKDIFLTGLLMGIAEGALRRHGASRLTTSLGLSRSGESAIYEGDNGARVAVRLKNGKPVRVKKASAASP